MSILGIRDERAVSLIETLLAVVMIGVIVLLLSNLPNAFNLISKSKHANLAREIATKQIEDKRAINYLNLVNDTTNITDQEDLRIGLLPNGSGTVVIEDCAAQICPNGEAIKKITVTVNWKDNNNLQTINIKTFIGEGGLNQ